MNKSLALSLESIGKSFSYGGSHINVLNEVNFELEQGEIVALVGASGAGKSTLLQIMGLLDEQTSGSVIIKNEKFSLDKKSKFSNKIREKRDHFRRNFIGFVYQNHYLLPELSALENVILPQLILGKSKQDAKLRASELLSEMGLSNRFNHTLHKLSGGEQQRVAIARALANKPEIILADEPTGNLDDKTAEQVFSMLINLAKDHNVSMVIATHNNDLANKMDRKVKLHLGNLI